MVTPLGSHRCRTNSNQTPVRNRKPPDRRSCARRACNSRHTGPFAAGIAATDHHVHSAAGSPPLGQGAVQEYDSCIGMRPPYALPPLPNLMAILHPLGADRGRVPHPVPPCPWSRSREPSSPERMVAELAPKRSRSDSRLEIEGAVRSRLHTSAAWPLGRGHLCLGHRCASRTAVPAGPLPTPLILAARLPPAARSSKRAPHRSWPRPARYRRRRGAKLPHKRSGPAESMSSGATEA